MVLSSGAFCHIDSINSERPGRANHPQTKRTFQSPRIVMEAHVLFLLSFPKSSVRAH